MQSIFSWIRKSLVRQILIGMGFGIIVGLILPKQTLADGTTFAPLAEYFQLLGDFFIKALKAVAPILVFTLVLHAISRHKSGQAKGLKTIIILYVIGTLCAAGVAVVASMLFPTTLLLQNSETIAQAPSSIVEVLTSLFFKMTDNPVNALASGNYVGILTWAILGGLALRQASDSTRAALDDAARVIHYIVSFVIRLAPFGVFGLVTHIVATTGFETFGIYQRLIFVLLGSMIFIAGVVNPLMVWFVLRENPYPLVWRCLTQSGVPAFFTRSSAANIPINLNLCEELGVREETYSISIPLGGNVNMAGAAITISVLSLAAAHTLGVEIHPLNALILCFLATLGATGASGVPGGSLMLIPMACSLLQVNADVAAQVVALGFIIGVIQDSAETALNSSSDALFTAAADLAEQKKLRAAGASAS